jgi:hypothetical protein
MFLVKVYTEWQDCCIWSFDEPSMQIGDSLSTATRLLRDVPRTTLLERDREGGLQKKKGLFQIVIMSVASNRLHSARQLRLGWAASKTATREISTWKQNLMHRAGSNETPMDKNQT